MRQIYYFELTPRAIIFRRVRIVAESSYYLRHVRPYVRMYQRACHWTDFHEIWYWGLKENTPRKSKICENRTKISGTVYEDLSTFCNYYCYC
jgi:hypothetical protein